MLVYASNDSVLAYLITHKKIEDKTIMSDRYKKYSYGRLISFHLSRDVFQYVHVE